MQALQEQTIAHQVLYTTISFSSSISKQPPNSSNNAKDENHNPNRPKETCEDSTENSAVRIIRLLREGDNKASRQIEVCENHNQYPK
jgi:hypothetical protein